MPHFDMHAHPTLKAGLTDDPATYDAWTDIPFFASGLRNLLLKSFKEILTSQSNLTQLQQSGTVAVIALIGLEKAFAGNWAIQKILASPRVSPLSRQLLIDVVRDNKSYYEMLQRDLQVLLNSDQQDQINVIKKFEELDPSKINLVLSIEGAHSFQSVKDDAGEQAIHQSIITNFKTWKNDPNIRIHHLTLAHLTRQPACVHCFGVKITVLGIINITRDVNFQPDPTKAGLSSLGHEIIKLAYDSASSKPILIDIKHMSFYARGQFYQLRKEQHWDAIPLLCSHSGVTGTSFAEASLTDIEHHSSGCSLVSWNRKKGLLNTFFNPWTINLFDDDIIAILESKGMIGISLDQRILGYQKKFVGGEFMSPVEINLLPFPPIEKGEAPGDFDQPLPLTAATEEVLLPADDAELVEILGIIEKDGEEEDITGNDLVFDIEEEEENGELELKGDDDPSHIDYLANNILHVIRVGYQNGFDGKSEKVDVTNHICIGSDLDGIVDSLNFAKNRRRSIDKNDWVTIDEYARLQQKLISSMESCIEEDDYLRSLQLNVEDIATKIMHGNGLAFLRKYFN